MASIAVEPPTTSKIDITNNTSTKSVMNPLKPYLPTKTLRSLNRQYKTENSEEYCKLASFIYKDDYRILDTQPTYAIITNNNKIRATVKFNKNNTYYNIKVKQVDNTLVIKGKSSPDPSIFNTTNIDNIDVMTAYNIFKSRNCDAYKSTSSSTYLSNYSSPSSSTSTSSTSSTSTSSTPYIHTTQSPTQPKGNFAQTNTIAFLRKLFDTYFQPDDMNDMLYLYTYLYANAVMLNYKPTTNFKHVYKLHHLPPQTLLDDIYDMYNLLYVHITLIH